MTFEQIELLKTIIASQILVELLAFAELFHTKITGFHNIIGLKSKMVSFSSGRFLDIAIACETFR